MKCPLSHIDINKKLLNCGHVLINVLWFFEYFSINVHLFNSTWLNSVRYILWTLILNYHFVDVIKTFYRNNRTLMYI